MIVLEIKLLISEYVIGLILAFVAIVYVWKSKKKKPNKLNYWIYMVFIFISFTILTVNVIIFSVHDSLYNIVNMLLPVIYLNTISICSYELLTKHYNKKKNERLWRLISQGIIICYLIIINYIKFNL